MTTVRNGIIATALAAALALSACGGTSSNALSQSDYKAKTDVACKQYKEQFQAALKKIDLTKPDAVKQAANAAADSLHAVAKRLRDIGYPEGKQDQANQFYDAIDKAADSLASNPNALKASEEPKEFKELDRLSKELGITNCGTSS